MNQKRFLWYLSGLSLISSTYLLNISPMDFYSFWYPLTIGFLFENGMVMPDIEFFEKMIKFLLGIMDR